MSEDLPRNRRRRGVSMQDPKLIALKMRGLPYRVQHEDIKKFFKDVHLHEKNIELHLPHSEIPQLPSSTHYAV